MSVINMAKNIKQIHPNSLILYKVGNFYQAYGKDAYIISYIFDYKINKVGSNVAVSGFPKNAISKIIANLERKSVNFMILDTKNNYKVDEQEDYKDLNTYTEIYENAHKIVALKLRVQKICETLVKEKNIEKIRKIEEIIYEN